MTAHRQRLEPRKKPAQKRSRATVDEILSAAAQVFEAHGYAAGTTNRVAERADRAPVARLSRACRLRPIVPWVILAGSRHSRRRGVGS